jgi:4a-hydroxytetrahydrobiopterin dehydratase
MMNQDEVFDINHLHSTLHEFDLDWEIEDGNKLKKVFEFENFQQAIDFLNKIVKTIQRHNHHPAISISYNQVVLTLMTHEKGGVTKKDIDLAKDIDRIV